MTSLMQNRNDTAANATLESLRELASATTRYYESPPEHMEAARMEYEAVLTRFNSVHSFDKSAEE